jgi:xylulokinase
VVNKNIASVSIGTGGMAITMLDKPYRDPAMKACIGSHAVFGNWQFEGYQIGAAGVFRWFRDEVAALEKAEAQKRGENTYIKLDEMIRDTMPGADGLICLPFLASAAAPRWNPDARGTLLGLTFAHGRKHIARAVIEGITLEQKDILNSMLVTGNRIDKVRIMGGAAKSVLWCQIQADMYNLKVETLRVPDAALVGAAIFAAIGVGLYDDIGKAVREMVHQEQEYVPDTERAELYETLYGIYCDAYEALDKSGVYGSIAKFQNDRCGGDKRS